MAWRHAIQISGRLRDNHPAMARQGRLNTVIVAGLRLIQPDSWRRQPAMISRPLRKISRAPVM